MTAPDHWLVSLAFIVFVGGLSSLITFGLSCDIRRWLAERKERREQAREDRANSLRVVRRSK